MWRDEHHPKRLTGTQVQEYVQRHATKEAIENNENEESGDESMSSIGSYESQDEGEEVAGALEV